MQVKRLMRKIEMQKTGVRKQSATEYRFQQTECELMKERKQNEAAFPLWSIRVNSMAAATSLGNFLQTP